MSYKLADVLHETHDFWVLRVPPYSGEHEVYRKGITCSTKVATIAYCDSEKSLARAIEECERRQAELDCRS